jgi:hypothetical protein
LDESLSWTYGPRLPYRCSMSTEKEYTSVLVCLSV